MHHDKGKTTPARRHRPDAQWALAGPDARPVHFTAGERRHVQDQGRSRDCVRPGALGPGPGRVGGARSGTVDVGRVRIRLARIPPDRAGRAASTSGARALRERAAPAHTPDPRGGAPGPHDDGDHPSLARQPPRGRSRTVDGRQVLPLLRAILNTAVEDRHLVVNPCSIKGAGIETSEERTIPTIGEVYALADAVTPRFRALVLLAAFGGLRRGELFGLTRGDIDLLHLTVDVRVQRQESRRGEALIGPPKTLAGRRTLALPTEVVPELEAHLARWVSVEPTASVFVGEQGGALRAGVWHKEWDRARRSVGLPDLHLHDLRHVAGTLAAATGPAPRRSCAASGTPPRRLRFATSTPPTNATACWPPESTA